MQTRSPRAAIGNLPLSLMGLVFVSIGTVAAIFAVPEDPQPAAALQLSASLLGIGLMAAPVLRIGRDHTSLLRTENALMFGLVYWLLLDPIQALYPMYGISYDVVVTEFIAIWLFACSVWIGVAGSGISPPRFLNRVAQLAIPDATLFKMIMASFILGIFYFAYSSDFNIGTMIDGLGRSRFAAPWSRRSLGDANAFVEQLSYFGYILPSLTVLLAHRRGWLQPHVILAIVLAAVMFAFLSQSGGRRIAGVIIGSALVSWMLLQQRFNLKLIVGTAVAILGLLAIMQTILSYRVSGFNTLFSEEGSLRDSAAESAGWKIQVDDNFLRFAQVIQVFPDIVPNLGLQPLTYNLVKPVPRVLWPDKPTSAGYDLTEILGMRGVSLTSSILGEFYAMSGLFAVCLGGLFFGLLGSMWNRVLDSPGGNSRGLTYGVGLMDMVAGLRSMQDLVLMSYGLLGWIVIASALARRRAARAAKQHSTVAQGGR